MKKEPAFGRLGLTLVRYLGGLVATVKGPCTGHGYPVDARNDNPFYVDSRDVPGLLKVTTRSGRPLFEVVK